MSRCSERSSNASSFRVPRSTRLAPMSADCLRSLRAGPKPIGRLDLWTSFSHRSFVGTLLFGDDDLGRTCRCARRSRSPKSRNAPIKEARCPRCIRLLRAKPHRRCCERRGCHEARRSRHGSRVQRPRKVRSRETAAARVVDGRLDADESFNRRIAVRGGHCGEVKSAAGSPQHHGVSRAVPASRSDGRPCSGGSDPGCPLRSQRSSRAAASLRLGAR